MSTVTFCWCRYCVKSNILYFGSPNSRLWVAKPPITGPDTKIVIIFTGRCGRKARLDFMQRVDHIRVSKHRRFHSISKCCRSAEGNDGFPRDREAGFSISSDHTSNCQTRKWRVRKMLPSAIGLWRVLTLDMTVKRCILSSQCRHVGKRNNGQVSNKFCYRLEQFSFTFFFCHTPFQ